MADPSETTQADLLAAPSENGEVLRALHALSSQVETLQVEVHALRNARLPEGDEPHGWGEATPSLRETGTWVRSLDSPRAHGLPVPWLAVEICFLAAVAVLAVAADFEPPVIAGVMALAFVLVAIAEWAGARAARRRDALLYGSFVAPPSVPDDPSWLDAVTQRTEADAGTEATDPRLPPPG